MSRWTIEKSGTGIEKSGTGIEKSGTGVEKSGTGVEKSGTGILRVALTVFIALASVSTQIVANENRDPAGSMQVVVENDKLAVSWIVDGSVFSGVANLSGSFASLALTEVGFANEEYSVRVAGGGTGKDVAGGGTGKDVAGGGTGANVAGGGTGANVAGGGTGASVAGGGTGASVAGGGTGATVAGGGTGASVAGGGTGASVAGGGTGVSVAGGGTGANSTDQVSSQILVAGGGTGSDAIVITLPGGTEMQMEVSLGCNVATVSVMDGNFAEVVSFSNVPVIGASSFCTGREPSYGRFREIAYAGPIGDSR